MMMMMMMMAKLGSSCLEKNAARVVANCKALAPHAIGQIETTVEKMQSF